MSEIELRLEKLIHSAVVEHLTIGTPAGAERIVRNLLAQYDLLPPDKRLPVPMRLQCPACGELHIDEGEFATKRHHTHACQACGMVWRPAIVPTVGVQFLPGFKNEVTP